LLFRLPLLCSSRLFFISSSAALTRYTLCSRSGIFLCWLDFFSLLQRLFLCLQFDFRLLSGLLALFS
jgi:hypothetical protein